jgi:predicted Zn-dependent peptidase
VKRATAGPLERSAPPPAGELRPFRFPHFQRIRATRELEIYLAPADPGTAGGALLHVELLALHGADAQSPERGGLAALTGALLDEGTATRSALEIAAAAEGLGGYLGSGADWETLHVSGTFLAEHWREGLDLVAEIATTPAFAEEEIERLRRRTLAEIRNRRAQPQTVARLALARRLYPGTPYGGSMIGDEASVTALRRDEISAFYEAARGGRWVAVAAGGMDPAQLAEAIAGAVPIERGTRTELPDPIRPEPREARQVVLVDRPGAAQTELYIGHPGLPRTHPDFTAAGVLNTLLGGKFTSRINLNLRERHAYTYGAHSRFAARRGPGPFTVSAAVANPSAAAAAHEVLLELERVRREPVDEEELADAASYLLGVFPYTVQTLDGVASRLTDLAVFGLPDDYWQALPGRVRGLSRGDIQRVAAEHLDPQRALVVAVGPADEIAPAFEDLGEVEVVPLTSF